MRVLQSLLLGLQTKGLLILGLGRLGIEVCEDASPLFRSVMGTTRREDLTLPKNARCIPFHNVVTDMDLSSVSHTIVTIQAPREEDDPIFRDFDKIVAKLPEDSWIGLISTTSVYRETDGGWVSEDSLTKEDSPYVYYESYWKKAPQSLTIFRCSGIYGPGRSALHTLYNKGYRPGGKIANRIHSYDIVQAMLASMLKKTENIFNLSDDFPASRQAVFEYGRELLEGEEVEISRSTLSARSRNQGSKRVRNTLMKSVLLPYLQYPSYKEGLKDILDDPNSPWNLQSRGG